MRRLLFAGLLAVSAVTVSAVSATAAGATVTTVSGSFLATDWAVYVPDPVSLPIDPLRLHYSLTFDSTLVYAADTDALTVFDTNIPHPLAFSYHPESGLIILATAGSPFLCSLPEQSTCIFIADTNSGLPSFVAKAPAGGGAWQAMTIRGDDRVDTGAVPEPASWALLIAGFGLTGAAMRRRRAAMQ